MRRMAIKYLPKSGWRSGFLTISRASMRKYTSSRRSAMTRAARAGMVKDGDMVRGILKEYFGSLPIEYCFVTYRHKEIGRQGRPGCLQVPARRLQPWAGIVCDMPKTRYGMNRTSRRQSRDNGPAYRDFRKWTGLRAGDGEADQGRYGGCAMGTVNFPIRDYIYICRIYFGLVKDHGKSG